MKHRYLVNVVEVNSNGESTESESRLQFEFVSHDDLMEIVAKNLQKGVFSEEQAKAFSLGIKLFSGVMLENRTNPLFSELAPQFGEFMKKLKGR